MPLYSSRYDILQWDLKTFVEVQIYTIVEQYPLHSMMSERSFLFLQPQSPRWAQSQ